MGSLYLPIAEAYVNIFFLIGLGALGGLLSGMLGIGGGMIMTPALIAMGIDPICAIASLNIYGVGSNLSGFLHYWVRRDVDIKLSLFIFLGGTFGCVCGWLLLDFLSWFNAVDTFIRLFYIMILVFMSLMLFKQSWNQTFRKEDYIKARQDKSWLLIFPFKTIFPIARIRVSFFVPLMLGILVGMATSLLGLSNGVLLMPLLTYLIGRSSPIVAGTSLLSGFFITLFVSLFYSFFEARLADLVLVFYVLLGGLFGTSLGAKIGYKIPRPFLGFLGALLMVLLLIKFLIAQHSLEALPRTVRPLESLNFLYRGLCLLAEKRPMLYEIVGVSASIACCIGARALMRKGPLVVLKEAYEWINEFVKQQLDRIVHKG